ncbi:MULTISPECIES: pyoverdine biosynthesis protein [Pseudomonas]|uniref:Pyoverdine biosynthesis protein n=1 Tax=Pseudomonas piscis TaxID=2614538 RepID=A0ABY9NBW2_9PSED|nr:MULTISPECIES: pyoverdine biosynthesis protein [Pseudomonas]POA55848.1 pyoverdine biosynthesis protein [Pseudomonas sp. FW507-12TSA]WMN15956.1 hypothetical protein QL104_21700 [Pseudomonas piscis]
MALVNPLSVESPGTGVMLGIDEIAARRMLFQALHVEGQESGAVDAQAMEAARQDRLAFWLSAQVHALYLDPPGCERPPVPNHEPACAGPDRCRYCQQEFDLLHKRAALLVLGRSGLLES